MSPFDARLKYCSLLISTLIRLFKVAELSQNLKFSFPPNLETWTHTEANQTLQNTKTISDQAMSRADDLRGARNKF